MEKLYLEPTPTSPLVILDRESGVFLIQGKSLPEDVKKFYQPIIFWLDSYIKNPNQNTVFEFDFEYFNTASSKMLLHLMSRLKELNSEGFEVEVIWKHPINDAELEEAGEEFAEIIQVPFRIVAKPEL